MNKSKTSINAIRMLGVDMVNKANSGHPGIVLGAAPMAYTLFTEHLSYNAKEPKWFNRDRFVMSAGHGSALLYSLLHFAGYNVTMDDLKQFRQWGSITPGHPEFGHADGVESTSGPLGQGIAMAAGMAVAERYLSGMLNKEDFNLIDHYTYVLCGDGDLQEGVTQETMSLAGHMGLSKLIVLYDSNDIQLDGPVKWANSENTQKKYESMNWQYIFVENGEDIDAISKAITQGKNNQDKPTIIEIKTIIGHGSPDAGSSKTHGAPIGEEKTVETRKTLQWDYEPFEIPSEVYGDFTDKNKEKGSAKFDEWNNKLAAYRDAYPDEAGYLDSIMNGNFEIDYDKIFNQYEKKTSVATRSSSGDLLNLLQKVNPLMIGGSADLSTSTKVKGINGDFSHDNPKGRNINFGVREHAMAAIVNGITLHGLKGFSGGFFIFSDYMKPAMRLAALMGIPSIFVFTHDSVAVGEDGPTHQPVEQLAGLRAVPNMTVIRPADINEVMGAWKIALESKDQPTSIALTRQDVPILENSSIEGTEKGGYIISSEKERLDAVIIATGSEVSLAIEVQKALLLESIDVRVVSLPSFEIFNRQTIAYKNTIVPTSIRKRIGIEMGATLGWHQYTGLDGLNITIDKFGASAKGETVVENYGFNVNDVLKRVKDYLM
ncbi:MAG: transketolase [Dethiosulfatibacter sp.]|nr:transketolase [Dethiosulfatibacter sp.]